MRTLTAEQRRELVERPFPVIRHSPTYRYTGPCTTQRGGLVEGHKRSYNGTAFNISGILYGEDYRRWS